MLPLLKECGGRLVQVTTTATAHPWPGLSVYTATKAAIEALQELPQLAEAPPEPRHLRRVRRDRPPQLRGGGEQELDVEKVGKA